MNKIIDYFYIFSKFSTSLVLLILLFATGYALFNSYNDIDKNAANLENKLLSISKNVDLNHKSSIEIKNKLIDQENDINKINKFISNKKIQINKEKEVFENLLNEIKNLEKELNTLKVSQLSNKDTDVEESVFIDDERIESTKELILLKYKDGKNIDSELLLLDNYFFDNKNAILEKLNTIKIKKFYGYNNLINEFSISLNTYVKDNFFITTDNKFINYLSNYITVTPSSLDIYDNEELNILMQAKKFLDLEETQKALNLVLRIKNIEDYFLEWIEQSKLYLEFNEELNKVS